MKQITVALLGITLILRRGLPPAERTWRLCRMSRRTCWSSADVETAHGRRREAAGPEWLEKAKPNEAVRAKATALWASLPDRPAATTCSIGSPPPWPWLIRKRPSC